MAPKEGPDPGAYDIASIITKPTLDLSIKGKSASQANVETTLALEQKMPNSIFKSTTDRFAVSYSAKNPGIRILQSKGGRRAKIVTQSEQGKHIYDKDAVFGIENQVTCLKTMDEWKHRQQRAADLEVSSGRRVGFDATSPRFNYNQVFYGQSLKLEVPGPGLYKDKGNVGDRPKTFNQPRNKNIKFFITT